MRKYYTVKEVADILNIGKRKAYRLVNQKDFPKLLIGGSIRIPQKEFEDFLDENLPDKM